MAFAETAKLAVRIDLEGNASAGLSRLDKQVKGLGSSLGRVGKGFGQVGAGLARAGLVVGGAAVAGLTGAAKAAIDFEDAFAGVRKTVDEAELTAAGLSFESLSDAFREMAREVPIAATEFARLGETAGALGVRAQDIEEFTRITALLGVTTNLSADEAADILGRIGTILRFTGKDYETFADSLVALGNAGASTESEIIEITKRFAAEGKASGLATDQIAALASATASLGFAPERGGTALARVFANMGTNISLANGKGKQFAKTTGRSITDLQAALNRGDGLTIFTDFLRGLKGLSATDANKVLKAAGITNTSDRTIFRTMADNLPFINEQLGIAATATGALSEEARKRFDTIASKIAILKNNIIDAGISVGEGLLPALGRAADKLTDFLKQPGTRSELQQLGRDIGEAIDDIDWAQVLSGAKQFVGVLRSALSFALDILSALNKLPTEVKAAGLGLLALNKASGGLIGAGVGNVVGGLAETAIRGLGSKLPGAAGRLFAQPVYVVNFPPGFGGGLGGAAGAAGGAAATGIAAGTVAITAAAVTAAVAGTLIAQAEYGEENQEFKDKGLNAAEVAAIRYYTASAADQATMAKRIGSIPTIADWESAVAKLNRFDTQPAVKPSPDNDPDKRQWRNDNPERVKELAEQRRIQEKLDRLRGAAERTKDDTVAGLSETKMAQIETKRETSRGATLMASTTRSGANSIVSAIAAYRPITTVSVNVTAASVTKSVTTNTRYGGTGASRATDKNAAKHV